MEGPVLHQTYIKYCEKLTDQRTAEISKKTGLSINHVKKMQSLMVIRDANVFTSRDLARYMGISERSANRILKRIVENGYGEIVSCERVPAVSGRPMNIVRVDF